MLIVSISYVARYYYYNLWSFINLKSLTVEFSDVSNICYFSTFFSRSFFIIDTLYY